MSDDLKKAAEALEQANRDLGDVADRLEAVNAGLAAAVRVCDERLPGIMARVEEAKAMGDGYLDAKPAVQEFLRMKRIASVRDLGKAGFAELREFLERKLSFVRAENGRRLD